MPPTPERTSRMQAETHEPSTVTSTSSALLLTKYSPGSTFTIQLPLDASKKRREATDPSAVETSLFRARAAPLTLLSDRRYGRRDAGRDATRSATRNARCKGS